MIPAFLLMCLKCILSFYLLLTSFIHSRDFFEGQVKLFNNSSSSRIIGKWYRTQLFHQKKRGYVYRLLLESELGYPRHLFRESILIPRYGVMLPVGCEKVEAYTHYAPKHYYTLPDEKVVFIIHEDLDLVIN